MVIKKYFIVAIVCIVSTNVVDANPDIIVKGNEKIAGLFQHEYVNMWWQWAVSMSDKESPIRDNIGNKCNVNQVGPVWFLAGGYGSSKISRKCSIPSDKYIFFPVINMLYYPPNTDESVSCDSVKKGAELNNQYISTFKVKIDDQEFVNPVYYRIASKKCFDLIARKENNQRQLEVYPSATDGYWIMLKPMSVGLHAITFRAEYDRPGGSFGKMVQDIEYTISIYEP
ncbi:hypothetical protein [Kaarinaea lacus]